MSLSTHQGLSLPDLSTHRGLARADLATILGLSGLPSVVTGGVVAGLTDPSVYYGFDSAVYAAPDYTYYEEVAGNRTTSDMYPANQAWYGEGAIMSPDSVRTLALPAATTSAAVSFWLKSAWAQAFGVRVADPGATWHHALIYVDGTTGTMYLDGVLSAAWSGTASLAGNSLTIEVGGDPHALDELAVWSDPGWATPATQAGLLYNAGMGTVYRGGAWYEIIGA